MHSELHSPFILIVLSFTQAFVYIIVPITPQLNVNKFRIPCGIYLHIGIFQYLSLMNNFI